MNKPTYEELEKRCIASEAMLEAIRSGQADMVISESGALVVRLAAAEEKASRIKRLLMAIREVNKFILQESDPVCLASGACSILTGLSRYRKAWIALLDPTGTRVLASASSGFEQIGDPVRSILQDCEFPNCINECIRNEKTLIIENSRETCRACPIARIQDAEFTLIRRLSVGDRFYGVLVVTVSEAYNPDEEELDLFDGLADDLSLALHKIELEGFRLAAETALRDKEEFLRTTGQMALVGGWEIDAQTLEVRWTEEKYRIHQVDQTFAPSLDDAINLFHENDREKLRQSINRALEFGEPYDLELRLSSSEKDQRWVHTSCKPVVVGKKVVKLRGAFQDITERKKLETQLLHAQKMEAIGTLAGGIAHDFNNLLQAVIGYTELLIQVQTPESADLAYLERILASGKRGAELVKNLLTFSRKVEPRFSRVNLNHEVGEAQKLLFYTIPKTVKIIVRSDGDLHDIMADSTQIGQVLMNIAVNARDAMSGAGTLTIEMENTLLDRDYSRLHPEIKPGPYVLISISDTGHGMDKHTLEHIFDPFFTTKEVGKGTGLGLASVYGIVKQHRGHISCYSEPGVGSTFKVYFPALKNENSEPIVNSETQLPSGTETIMLVDDEPSLLELGRKILNRFGYKVIEASDGRVALDVYRDGGHSISLVLMDLNMPEMDGISCLSEILKLNPDARVLLVTGFLDSSPSVDPKSVGAVGLISKPYNLRRLLTEVRRALD
ncbi:MAG: response regulator [Desulfomonilaceae bacterium]